MNFGAGTYGIALIAGLLTTLSPCVLPLIPILMGSAVTAHRLGPWALACGVALSFSLAGVLLASVGASLGLSGDTFRQVAASLLIVFGLILLSGRLQARARGRHGGRYRLGKCAPVPIHASRAGGTVRTGLAARGRMEPVRGPYPRCCHDARQRRTESRTSIASDGCLRTGCQCPVARDRFPLASNTTAAQRVPQQSRPAWQAGARNRVALTWSAHSHSRRSSARSVAARPFTRLAHRTHDQVLMQGSSFPVPTRIASEQLKSG